MVTEKTAPELKAELNSSADVIILIPNLWGAAQVIGAILIIARQLAIGGRNYEFFGKVVSGTL